MMRLLAVLLLFWVQLLFAESNTTVTQTKNDTQKHAYLYQTLPESFQSRRQEIEESIWSKIYSNYHTFKALQNKQSQLIKQINRLKRKHHLNDEQKAQLSTLKSELHTLTGKIQLLHEYENDPFKKLLTPPETGKIPTVGNPLAIIGALSFLEKLKRDKEEYENRYRSLKALNETLQKQALETQRLIETGHYDNGYLEGYLSQLEDEIATLKPVKEIFETTRTVYNKKIEEIKLNLKSDIQKEIRKALIILGVLLAFLVVLFIIKYFVRKYMSDNERFYTINKALNVTFLILSLLTILFAYIENVSYLVTILGFASAGIAIAMKDLFMSLLGWFAIVLGGTIHVGDRVKFTKDGFEYVGDIVDISLLRMTLHEDVTLTSYYKNRRTGRIIFIPNNVVFTDLIANYSHAGLKTVWDGIDFMITFDSDIQRAASIAKEVTRKYSKGYTDITRKQLNRLRSHYSIRNTNVEPRILTFIEEYGIKISAWYLTNSYATLTLRSTISAEIARRIQQEECVTFAFPTHSLYYKRGIPEAGCMLEETHGDGAQEGMPS